MAKPTIKIPIVAQDKTGKAFRAATSNAERLKIAVSGMGGAMGLLGIAAAGAAAGIIKLGHAYGQAVGTAAKFQKNLFEINTLLNADQATIKALGGDLQRLSVQFGQTAEDMARAQYNVVSAGFADVAESMHVLEVASKAAIGGITDVNTAAGVITQTLNAFGLEASDSTEVADILFNTVKGGVTTFEELAGSLGKVSGTAALAGLEFREVAAAIAVMTKKGISSEEATTALNSLIVAIGAASGEQKDKLDALGITLEDGLAPALAAVDRAGGDSLSVLKDIVKNVRALKAAAAAGADGARELNEQLAMMAANGGAAEVAFKTMAESVIFQQERMAAATEHLKTVTGGFALDAAGLGYEKFANALEGAAGFIESNAAALVDLAAVIPGLGSTINAINVAGFKGDMADLRAETERLKDAWGPLIFTMDGARDYMARADGVMTPLIFTAAGLTDHLKLLRQAWFELPAEAPGNVEAAKATFDSLAGAATRLGVSLQNIKVGISGERLWVNKTPAELMDDIRGVMQDAWDAAPPMVITPQVSFNDSLIGPGFRESAVGQLDDVAAAAGTMGDALGDAGAAGAGRMADAIGQAVFQSQDFLESLGRTAQSIFSTIFSGFLRFGIGTLIGGPVGGLIAGVRADGGPVSGGAPYIVGEEGPELFVPSGSGTIIPNGAAVGGATYNVTVVSEGLTLDDPMVLRRVGEKVKTEIEKLTTYHGPIGAAT